MAKVMMENEPVEVKWDNEPLDVSLERHGNKKPDRKVKVRGILRDEWLEREADVEPGAVHRLVEAIKKALRHSYEPRMDESIRFVHMVDYLSEVPQALPGREEERMRRRPREKVKVNSGGRGISESTWTNRNAAKAVSVWSS